MSIEEITNNYFDKSTTAYKDYISVRNFFNNEKIDPIAFKDSPGWLSNFKEEFKQDDHVCAKALIALAVLNGPTDFEEFVGAAKQIRELCGGEKVKDYNHKIAQHPFSFLRGTILHDYLNPNSENCLNKKLAKKIIKMDKSLYETKIGEWLSKKLGVEERGTIKTKIKDLQHTHEKPRYVLARVLKSKNKFSDLTVRAMLRTTKLGTITMGALGAIHAGYRIKEGNDVKETLAKTAIQIGTSIAAVGYLGAAGSKYGRTLGSLTGVIAGTAIGAAAPKIVDKIKDL